MKLRVYVSKIYRNQSELTNLFKKWNKITIMVVNI
jgi:hypothetical protein